MNRLGKHLAIWGSLFQLGIVGGVVVSLVQMHRATNAIDPSDATAMNEVISALDVSFHASRMGLVTGAFGGVLLMAAMFGCHYRAPWLHSVLCVSALFWLFGAFPVGLIMLGYVIFDRKSLRPSPEVSVTPGGPDVEEAGADPTGVFSHGGAEARRGE